MTPRCQKLVEKSEVIILKHPTACRRFAGTLILFLRVRKLDGYYEDLDFINRAAAELLKYPQAEADVELLMAEVEIAGGFPKLTKSEAGDFSNYLLGLLTKSGDYLSKYLADELGGKIDVSDEIEEIVNGRIINFQRIDKEYHKIFKIFSRLKNLYNDAIVEDFRLKFSGKFTRIHIFGLIRKYYEERGYNLLQDIDSLGLMFRKGKTDVIICVTYLHDEIMVTVNMYHF